MERFISFSGGVESTTMCILFGNKADAIFSDTGWEHEKLYERIDLVEKKVREFHGNDFKVHRIKSEKYNSLPEYIQLAKVYPQWDMRFCTRIFKIEPIDEYLKKYKDQGAEIMIGLNSDEAEQRTGNHGNLAFIKYSYPLVEAGINRRMCEEVCNSLDLHPNFPAYMKRGGCKGCPFKSKREYKAMIHLSPDEYDEVMELEEEIQDKRESFYHVLDHLGISMRDYKKSVLDQPELFDPKENYSIVNNVTKCGVFCNR